jgi:hypothetical protein
MTVNQKSLIVGFVAGYLLHMAVIWIAFELFMK